MQKFTVTVTVKQEITLDQIANLLVGAFEGGSNYWYEITGYRKPTSLFTWDNPAHVYKHVQYPLSENGAVLIGDQTDEDCPGYRLDLAAINEGLQVFATKYPKHYQDFVAEKYDAYTSDVFLQCCIFGDCIYG